ncbi:MAG: hypothetical protein ACR2L6_10715 [Gemmatimonadaceae bacterium]
MLRILFEKQPDGSIQFRCTRADGSSTWQKHAGKSAMFFPFHDLTHFAVESTFGFRQGFYGLISEGWDIADTGGKGARGRLPPEAIIVEQMVGLFDRERVGGAPALTAAEFNGILQELADAGDIISPPVVTEAQLQTVRARISELYDGLSSLQPGSAMELTFGAAA